MADNLTPEQRKRLMCNIKTKNTNIERIIQQQLIKKGIKFQRHVHKLPGTPDIVFIKEKVVIFIDGDFWHGYRFPLWKTKLQPFWQNKIQTNRKRDKQNFLKLKRKGWTIIRLWKHEIINTPEKTISRIISILKK
jgi:DNA mismatch endonuclease (patch repair protein)